MLSKVSAWVGFSLSLSFVEGLGDDWVVDLEGMESRMLSSEDDFNNSVGDVTGAPSNLSYEVSSGVCWGISGGALLLKICLN